MLDCAADVSLYRSAGEWGRTSFSRLGCRCITSTPDLLEGECMYTSSLLHCLSSLWFSAAQLLSHKTPAIKQCEQAREWNSGAMPCWFCMTLHHLHQRYCNPVGLMLHWKDPTCRKAEEFSGQFWKIKSDKSGGDKLRVKQRNEDRW